MGGHLDPNLESTRSYLGKWVQVPYLFLMGVMSHALRYWVSRVN